MTVMDRLNDCQISLVSGYVYSYLCAHNELINHLENGNGRDMELEIQDEASLSDLSDMLSFYLGRPQKAEKIFDNIPTSLSKADFNSRVREVLESF